MHVLDPLVDLFVSEVSRMEAKSAADVRINDSVDNTAIASEDDFTIDGPNGRHLCYVSQPGGPSLSAVSDSPGEIAGTRRLRAPLARKLARQLAHAVSLIHDAGIVHGGMLNAVEGDAACSSLG